MESSTCIIAPTRRSAVATGGADKDFAVEDCPCAGRVWGRANFQNLGGGVRKSRICNHQSLWGVWFRTTGYPRSNTMHPMCSWTSTVYILSGGRKASLSPHNMYIGASQVRCEGAYRKPAGAVRLQTRLRFPALPALPMHAAHSLPPSCPAVLLLCVGTASK